MSRHSQCFLAVLVLVGLVWTCPTAAASDDHEAATKAAIARVAPSVVQIITQGGTDQVVIGPKGPTFRKALGPTTGLIVSPDGYIISSAFNFINSPTSILIEVPGRNDKFIAKKIATDTSRMLTLLKIDAKDLPVQQVAPKKEIRVGQWALALGRTLDTDQSNPPSVSIGIISALDRIWGKCIQTDANTSPVNYGGPLIDIQGRVMGIIIPASPHGTDQTAGFEWYDSGIGFAVPMEDILAVLPKLKEGKDLKPGLLGVQLNATDMFSVPPKVAAVTPNSSAAKAGLKPGDTITEIDGKPVVRVAQIKHLIGPKYEGEKVTIKYKRGDKEFTIDNLELIADMAALTNAFLGILPVRDDPKLGVEVRYVYAGSPAAKAGIKAGDRIIKYGVDKSLRSFRGNDPGRIELLEFLNSQQPGAEIKLEIQRQESKKTETITATLVAFPGTAKEGKDAPPAELPALATLKKALEPLEKGKQIPPKLDPKKFRPGKDGDAKNQDVQQKEKQEDPQKKDGQKDEQKDQQKKEEIETGLLKRTTANGNQKYMVYLDDDYNPNIAHALIVWLHPPGKNEEKDFEEMATVWGEACAEHNIIMVFPTTDSASGWVPSDSQAVQEVIRDVMNKYTIDKQRIIAHGMGVGGQMAIYLGFNARDLIRGVATTGAVPTGIKDNVIDRRVQFFIVVGDRDPLAKAVAASREDMAKHNVPAIYREIEGLGRQYLVEETFNELIRWIDSLDRM